MPISQTVKSLMETNLNLNQKLYMDNYYNSFDLCKACVKKVFSVAEL